MRKLLFLLGFLPSVLFAQNAITYQKPPQALVDLLLAAPTPSVSVDNKAEFMILSEGSSYRGVEDLAQPELRIAGLRLNPNNYSASRGSHIVNFKIKNIASGKEMQVKALPANLKASFPNWNPSQTKFAFTNNTNNGIDLYVVDVKSQQATKTNKTYLNTVLENFSWEDDATLLYAATTKPASAAPKKPLAPEGPIVQENLGKAAPTRTYQDLIRNPYEEKLFEFYATSQLIRNANGVETKIGVPGIYDRVRYSPDKKFLLVNEIQKPFSYLVPASQFASSTVILNRNGVEVKMLAKNLSGETSPSGFDNVQNAPSGFSWRDDEPATVYWRQPLDSGMYKNKMDYHDAVYALSAPFTGTPKQLLKTQYRFRGIQWGNNGVALVNEGLQRQQLTRTSTFNTATGEMKSIIERSTSDAYGDPGAPNTIKNQYGRQVVQWIDGDKLLMTGSGASSKGDYPFLATYNINTKKNDIIWQSDDGSYESVIKIIDADKKIFVTSKQSQTETPNYYLKNLSIGSTKALTNFTDPQPALRLVKKEKIFYKRKDGVDLSATLYTPENFNPKKDKPLPVIMWAYPREFKSAADAGQVRGSQNTFTRLAWNSPIYWVTQGYAVMDATEFPIVGEGDNQPNDNFVEQLRWNAEAAIDKVVDMKVGDRKRIAVGGHSYGAFMTANLLAHTRLFKAGLARSGAYNRTLTPFGFQNEERTYWQAPDIYNKMSPFAFADKIKDPILLIHGEADDNSGTFPIQSERLYNAIKGHGGTVRYVVLPYEAHSYAAKENLLHMLWEMNTWLDKYVKNVN